MDFNYIMITINAIGLPSIIGFFVKAHNDLTMIKYKLNLIEVYKDETRRMVESLATNIALLEGKRHEDNLQFSKSITEFKEALRSLNDTLKELKQDFKQNQK